MRCVCTLYSVPHLVLCLCVRCHPLPLEPDSLTGRTVRCLSSPCARSTCLLLGTDALTECSLAAGGHACVAAASRDAGSRPCRAPSASRATAGGPAAGAARSCFAPELARRSKASPLRSAAGRPRSCACARRDGVDACRGAAALRRGVPNEAAGPGWQIASTPPKGVPQKATLVHSASLHAHEAPNTTESTQHQTCFT